MLGNYVIGKYNDIAHGDFATRHMAIGAIQSDVALLVLGVGEMQTTKVGVGYRAVHPAYAESTMAEGFYRSGASGRLGADGLYANTTAKGAIAEFQYHNPGVTPAVFEVRYPLSKPLLIDPPSGYFSGQLPFTQGSNILAAPSLRAPSTTNLLIRQGATVGKRIQ
jgi:hypothetical protein